MNVVLCTAILDEQPPDMLPGDFYEDCRSACQ